MESSDDDGPVFGLRRYVALTAEALGVAAEVPSVHFGSPTEVYLALDQHLRAFPTRDAVLLWDELHGWALAIETHGGADLTVLGYLGGDVLPSPQEVARYVRRAIDGLGVGEAAPPRSHTADPVDGLMRRLAGYAGRVESPVPSRLAREIGSITGGER